MTELALLGGTPVLSKPLSRYRSIGKKETDAVVEVMRTGKLSGFIGSWGEHFLGGPVVRDFEARWARRFGVRHAVSMNSATSGLYAAMGAVGVEGGDEVIVPPLSMSATAMAPLVYGGVPIFADVEPDTLCLDPEAVEVLITPRTKAILAVNLYGHPARLAQLREIADAHGIWLVEDNAQAILATEGDRYTGTVGHIGVFSLNYHKHIHSGEGGICVTSDDGLALRLQMIRNHGENVVDALDLTDLSNTVGFNYRLSELSAAIARCQLDGVEERVRHRETLGEALSNGVRGLEGLVVPMVRRGCRHVYYGWQLKVEEEALGVSRAVFAEALAAEGVPSFSGGLRPLYLLPVFRERVAFGSRGYPFTQAPTVEYGPGLCPVAERAYEREALVVDTCGVRVDGRLTSLMVEAFQKVHAGRKELRRFQPKQGWTG